MRVLLDDYHFMRKKGGKPAVELELQGISPMAHGCWMCLVGNRGTQEHLWTVNFQQANKQLDKQEHQLSSAKQYWSQHSEALKKDMVGPPCPDVNKLCIQEKREVRAMRLEDRRLKRPKCYHGGL